MAETGWFRTEGGSVIEMDLPLHEAIQQRVTKGAIVRVADADGSPYVEEAAEESPTLTKSSTKAEWVGWAVRNGMTPDDAEAMTKNDLIELHGRVMADAEE